MGFAEVLTWFQQWGGLQIGTAVAVGLLVSYAAVKGGQAIFGGASPVPLADLDAEMKTVSTKLQKMTRLHPSITDDKDFLQSAIEGEFKTFETNVLATYPQFFVEGKLLDDKKRIAEYQKIEESLKDKSEEEKAKFKWQTVDAILVTYANCARVVADLPKNADELATRKKAIAEFEEQQRLAQIEQDRLQAEQDKLNNGQNGQTNDQNGQTNDQNGQTNGQNGTNNNNGTNGSSNNGTGKPKPSTTPTKNDKKKEGMAWYWWLVIIVGILSVLGAVAYLFLGTDPANDEEYSPEQEA